VELAGAAVPEGDALAGTPDAARAVGVAGVACPLGELPEDVHPVIKAATPTAAMSAAGVFFSASFITPMTLPRSSRLGAVSLYRFY
jgi:hypothetical protein